MSIPAPVHDVEHRVTPLELFFDLVFVFGFTQVTTLIADDPTWGGLGRGLLALAVLWWAWASYAWLTNTVDADAGMVIAVLLLATAAMFIAALAVPEAFDRHPYVFGVSFLLVLAMNVALFALAAKAQPDLLAAVLRATRWSIAGGVLILLAAFASPSVRPYVWLAALALGMGGPLFNGTQGFRVHISHFAERHGLIVIIAIGEALVAIGYGARGTALDAGAIAGAVLGLAVAASFWLAYFDFSSIGLEHVLSETPGQRRIALARDVYTYLHLPMVAGIVLFAFAMTKALAHVGDELDTITAVALCGGSALFLSAFVAVRLRVAGSLSRGRSVATCGFLVALPLSTAVPALVALALVAAVWVALHAYELIWWREQRAKRRALRAPASPA